MTINILEFFIFEDYLLLTACCIPYPHDKPFPIDLHLLSCKRSAYSLRKLELG